MQEQTTQPIAENLWWVIPGKLAGVRKPEPQEIPELQAAGIGAIVSVFHEASNLELYQQAGIPHLWLPIPVDAVPTLEQLQEFQSFVEQQTHQGHAVAVHCSTGRHRTGTLLAAYLIHQGMSYEEAMGVVLQSNSSIELPETQSGFLQRLPRC